MVKTLLITLMVLAIGGLQVNPLNAAETGSLHGSVVRASDQAALPGVEVLAYESGQTDPVATVLTDAKGNFVLTDIPVGLYRLKLKHDAYRTMLVDGVIVRANEKVRLEPPIKMLALSDALVQASKCASLVQPGQTASVYVVCAETLPGK